MNLSTIKKAIAIYRVNSLIFLCLFFLSLEARSQDMRSYCFDRSVNLREAHQSLKILLLPKDIVDQRIEDNCLDLITSSDRGNLFEKFLSKRYDLKKDPQGEAQAAGPKECRLDLKTTKKSKKESSTFKFGEKNAINSAVATMDSISIMEMLLGTDLPGEFEAGDEKLKVTCRLIGSSDASLMFSYSDKNKASVNTQVQLKKGEWLNVASVIKELNDKNKMIGIPQTEISESKGNAETIYELQFK